MDANSRRGKLGRSDWERSEMGCDSWCIMGSNQGGTARLASGGIRAMISKIIDVATAVLVVAALNMAWNVGVPVVGFIRSADERIDAGTATARVSGLKIRDCIFVFNSEVGWYRSGGTWHETPFQFLNDTSPNSSKPSGWWRQSFGVFEWGFIPDGADEVRLTVQHDCDGKIRTTMSGVFPLSAFEPGPL